MVVQTNLDPSKIHSFAYRANELATFALTLFVVMCGIASLSDNFNVPNPTVDVKILDINWFQKQPHGNDEISDINWFQKQPHGNDEILDINWFQKQPHGNDEVSLTLNISADLQSMFTWNTKQIFVFVAAEYATPQNALNQVSLWDGIITSKEHAKFHIHTTNKYGFIDQGSNLRGKEFNMTLHWHVMPKTGKMFADKIVTTGYRLPYNYYLPDKYR